MRIFSSSIWVLPALLFNRAVADGPTPSGAANFTFVGESFLGVKVANNQSSVFNFEDLKSNGKTFHWTQEGDQVEVLQVDLVSNGSDTIASWCAPDETCSQSDGFIGSSILAVLPMMDAASYS